MFFFVLRFWSALAVAVPAAPVAAVVDTTALVSVILATHGGNPQYTGRVAEAVVRYAGKHEVDPLLVAGIITVENPDLIPTARNPSGATGIMQVMPHWKADITDCGTSLKHIDTNVCFGTRILAINSQGRSDMEALYRYNGCRTITQQCRVYARTVLRRAHGVRARRSPSTP